MEVCFLLLCTIIINVRLSGFQILVVSFCREHTSVLQNIASVMTCVRQHETNSRWLMELLGQIENTVNNKIDSDNQQVSTATIIPTWANFKPDIEN